MATAYAALVSLLNNLDLIQNHPHHSFSFENKQIQSLLESVCFLTDFMEACDYHGGSSLAAEDLERRIACAAHAAEDVIESHVVDQIRGGSTLAGKMKSRFLLDLQKVIEDMEFVKRKAVKVKAESGFKAEKAAYSAAATSSTPLTSEKNSMVGFDDALHQLLDLLTREATGRRVIPITGMGGIGKTTLARNAFQHKLIMEHFDVHLWATISQQYVAEGILKELLFCLSESTSGTFTELGERLHKGLCERRYLIILDDMWSVKAWDKIQIYFPKDKDNKSRIVVTSRQSDLAEHLTSSAPCFPLDLLDKDKSWDLFCEKAFVEQCCPPELKKVGKKIVRKCKGLPLAIVVVGGHLRKSSRTQEYWENVANHMNSVLSSGENDPCLDVLSLSYSCLPIHLKPCFLYMGILKEDHRIKAATLIKLWIGEGFLKPSKTHSLEEVAEEYLEDLVDRNLISACERNLSGKIGICEIHDVLRELCLRIAGKEEFFCWLDTPRAIHRERRVVIHEGIPEEMLHPKSFDAPRSAPLIRSLTCNGGDRLLFGLKFLRVLNKVDGDFLESDFHQVNLRYLHCYIGSNSSKLHPFYLTPSISLLWSLQTLIIRKTSTIPSIMAPYEFWEMLQLRHVEIDGVCLLDPLPSDSDRLGQAKLQTLLEVENFRLSEEVCRRIPNIKKLKVAYYNFESEFDESRSHYCPHNLDRLHKLELLTCTFSDEPEWRDFARSLTFPNSLKQLSLTESRLYWEELSMKVGSLPLLEILELSYNAVIGSEWTTIEGKFICLKSLMICGCDDLVKLNADKSHFPVLKDLALFKLSKLNELPSSIGEIPTLHRIDLRDCSVSLALSAMRILVEQEGEYGSEDLRLEVSFGYLNRNRNSFLEKLEEEGLSSNNLFLFGNQFEMFEDDNPSSCTVM